MDCRNRTFLREFSESGIYVHESVTGLFDSLNPTNKPIVPFKFAN